MALENIIKQVKKGIIIGTIALTAACGGGKGNPNSPTPPTQPTNFSLKGQVTETFTRSPLTNIDVVVDGSGKKYEGKTNNTGDYEIKIDTNGTYNILYGIDKNNQQSNTAYIPSIYENITLNGEKRLDTDLANYNKLFANEPAKNIIEAYRGFHNQIHEGGVNQTWNRQPEKWIIYDPGKLTTTYPNPKNNPIINNVLTVWNSMSQYTGGYLQVPSRDQIELRIQGTCGVPRAQIEENTLNFEIAYPAAPAATESDFSNLQNEIIHSCARAPLETDGKIDLTLGIAESHASVQGGGNESPGYSTFFNRGVTDSRYTARDALHLTWGDFNYNKRKPGEKMLPSGDRVPSPYGYVVEYRKQ